MRTRASGGRPPSRVHVLCDPLIQHGLGEPDVAPDTYAGQSPFPDRFIDPAWAHRENLRRIRRPKERLPATRIGRTGGCGVFG